MIGRNAIPPQPDNSSLTRILNRLREEIRRIGNIKGVGNIEVSSNAAGIFVSDTGNTTETNWRNNSGETCPAYGVFRVSSIDNAKTLVGVKPSTTFSRLYAVNSDKQIDNGETGKCYVSGLRRCLCYSSLIPQTGEHWGPEAGQWYLRKGRPGWSAFGSLSTSPASTGLFQIEPINALIGKTSQPLYGSSDASGAADITVWVGTASGSPVYETSTMTLRANDWLLASGQFIAANKKIILQWVAGRWIVSEGEC